MEEQIFTRILNEVNCFGSRISEGKPIQYEYLVLPAIMLPSHLTHGKYIDFGHAVCEPDNPL
jgi:hypothetical protein